MPCGHGSTPRRNSKWSTWRLSARGRISKGASIGPEVALPRRSCSVRQPAIGRLSTLRERLARPGHLTHFASASGTRTPSVTCPRRSFVELGCRYDYVQPMWCVAIHASVNPAVLPERRVRQTPADAAPVATSLSRPSRRAGRRFGLCAAVVAATVCLGVDVPDIAERMDVTSSQTGPPLPTPDTASTAAAPAAALGRWAPRWPRPTGPSALAAVSCLSRRAMAACSSRPTRGA